MNRRPPPARERRTSARMERKDRNRKKADVVGTLRFVLLMALVTQCLRVGFASPRLQLQEVQVTGTQRFSPDDVTRIGAVHLGQNIFRANLSRISARLEAEPVIQEAVVTRELPHSLRVEIRERVPAIQVITPKGNFHADAEGVVFQRAPALTRELSLLQVPAKDLPALGEKLRPEYVTSVRECGRLAQKEGLDLRFLRVDDAGELWLNIATHPNGPQSDDSGGSRLKVRVGRATELPEKFRDVRLVLHNWPNLAATAAYLNVMCAGRPVYKTAAAVAAPPESASGLPAGAPSDQ